MANEFLIYIGAALSLIWGVAHLFPTKGVVKGFGDISVDNRRILTMEWISEGAGLIFAGLSVGGVTLIDSSNSVSQFIYYLASIFLISMAIISLFTGFKVNFLAYRLCPVLFTVAAICILLGNFLTM